MNRMPSWTRLQRAVAMVTGAYAMMGGIVTLVGWALGIPRLTSWDGSGIVMKANTAVAVIAAGLALLLWQGGRRRAVLVRGLGTMVTVIGGLTLLQHLTGLNFGIDTLLVHEPPGAPATTAPGRMGPPASTCFTLFGLALLFLTGKTRTRYWAAVLGTAVLGIAALSLVGYLYNSSPLFSFPRLTGIALQTASMLAGLALGLIMSVSEHGLGEALHRDDAGGIVLRRLMLAMIFLPVIIGWMRVQGERAGLYDSAFGSASRTLCEIVLLLGVLWWTARGLSRSDQKVREMHGRMVAELAATQRLQSISTELIREERFESIYGKILDAALDMMRAHFASIQMYHRAPDGTGDLRLLDARGFTAESAKFWSTVTIDSPGTCGVALQTRQRAVAADVEECASLAGTETLAMFRLNGIRACQTTPLISRSGELVGMISTHWREPHQPWENELRLFDVLVRQAADLIDRRRAEDELREGRTELAAANQQLASRTKQLDKLVERRTAELREIIGELEAFSYSLAHDLREPLRAMQGYTNILRDDYGERLDEIGQGYLTRIGAAAERMHRLLTDVLSYSRVTREALPLASIALQPLLQDILEQYPSLRHAQIRITGELPAVMGHQAALTQVISNLLTNAVKFMPSGRAPQVEVSAASEGDWVTLSVQDNGIGIAPEHQERIFRMFERIHSGTKYDGTGIGLAIVRRSVDRMGGSVGVESKVGHGSQFYVRLRKASS